jgi:hypothetical protein
MPGIAFDEAGKQTLRMQADRALSDICRMQAEHSPVIWAGAIMSREWLIMRR